MFSKFFGSGHSNEQDEEEQDRASLSSADNYEEKDDEDEQDSEDFEDAQDGDEREETSKNSKNSKSKKGKESKKKKEKNKEDKSDNPLLPEEMCELPTFLHTACCDKELVEETRALLKKKYLKRPESFWQQDYELMLRDDWAVSRFLLRCRQNPKRAAKLMEECGKFRREYRMGVSQMSDFPSEFHRAGGLFKYAPDRVGNQTLYMRIKMHRRVPELSQLLKEFILCCLEQCDQANGGRGTAVIFDLTNCGVQNVDPSFLFWLVGSFRNYCPKGLSYIIVYNLPWILNGIARLALSWLSSTNRRRLRFVSGDAIQDFIAPENLPDYLGGTCKLGYRQVPEGSRPAEETAELCNLTKEQARKLKEVYAKFLKDVDSDIEIDDDQEGDAGLISSSLVAS